MKFNTLKLGLITALSVSLLAFSGCSKDESSKSHKVVFKAEATAGSNVSQVVYGYDATTTTATSLSGNTWSSQEINVPAGTSTLSVAMNAIGADGNSTLKVQIYVDGDLKKEGTASGAILSASATYMLK